MLRFAANLNWLYTEQPFLDRFKAASEDDFKAIECLFPYDYAISDLQARLSQYDLKCVLLNAPAGNWSQGERGLASWPGREPAFQRSFWQALEYAEQLQCPAIHVMAGLRLEPAGPAQEAQQWATYQANLAWAAQQADVHHIQILIEPINPWDMPGYLLTRPAHAQHMIETIGAANLGLQLDLYHCQRVEGSVLPWLQKGLQGPYAAWLKHIQIAGVPGRHEPRAGAIDYPQLFKLIAASAYSGWVGCEYQPEHLAPGGTSQGLDWRP